MGGEGGEREEERVGGRERGGGEEEEDKEEEEVCNEEFRILQAIPNKIGPAQEGGGGRG